MSNESPIPEEAEHPLSAVPNLPADWVAALGSLWITTAEQVLSLASTPQGVKSLEAMPGSGGANVEHLLAVLTEVVGKQRAEQLRQAAAGGPLGARLTEDQKDRFGAK